jgi:hypothetical protein
MACSTIGLIAIVQLAGNIQIFRGCTPQFFVNPIAKQRIFQEIEYAEPYYEPA